MWLRPPRYGGKSYETFAADSAEISPDTVHHNGARLDAARASLKSEDRPPNVVSIAEARAQRLKWRRHGLRGNDEGPYRRP
jgi:hypothetical protein